MDLNLHSVISSENHLNSKNRGKMHMLYELHGFILLPSNVTFLRLFTC